MEIAGKPGGHWSIIGYPALEAYQRRDDLVWILAGDKTGEDRASDSCPVVDPDPVPSKRRNLDFASKKNRRRPRCIAPAPWGFPSCICSKKYTIRDNHLFQCNCDEKAASALPEVDGQPFALKKKRSPVAGYRHRASKWAKPASCHKHRASNYTFTWERECLCSCANSSHQIIIPANEKTFRIQLIIPIQSPPC